MQLPMQITFRDLPPTDAIKSYIEKRAKKLDTFDRRIMRCRVVVEAPHRHQRHGRHFRVHVDVTLPQHELVVDRDPTEHKPYEDLYAAIDESFDEMQRRIQDAVALRRRKVKQHTPAFEHGRVVKLFKRSGYGFLERDDGSEVYFHRNSVLGRTFAKLHFGAEVKFVSEVGTDGPQATTVIAE